MARPRFSPVKDDSTANIGFEQKLRLASDKWKNNGDAVEPCGARQPAKGNPQGERGGVHRFGVSPKPARHDSANTGTQGNLQVVSEARDKLTGVDFVCLRYATAVLVNGSMASNQSGEGDIRKALIEADLVDCVIALRSWKSPQCNLSTSILWQSLNQQFSLTSPMRR